MHFENYHPGILLLYFSTVILCTICFQHPVFLILSFVTSFLCSAWLGTRKSIVIHLCFLPIAILFACYYAVGNHFGVTNLRQNMAGNRKEDRRGNDFRRAFAQFGVLHQTESVDEHYKQHAGYSFRSAVVGRNGAFVFQR